MEQEFDLNRSVTEEEFIHELDAIWKDVLTDSDLIRKAAAKGIDLTKMRRDAAISVRQGVGIDPVFTPVIIGLGTALTPVAVQVVRDIWEQVVLPRIRREKGEDALRAR